MNERTKLPRNWNRTTPARAPRKPVTKAPLDMPVLAPMDPRTMAACLLGLQQLGADDLADVLGVTPEQIRALHKPVHLTFSWAQGVRAEDPCEVGGKAGNDRECGCWGDVDRYVYCLDLSGHTSHHEDHPCPTVRLLDELDAAARGELP